MKMITNYLSAEKKIIKSILRLTPRLYFLKARNKY